MFEVEKIDPVNTHFFTVHEENLGLVDVQTLFSYNYLKVLTDINSNSFKGSQQIR